MHTHMMFDLLGKGGSREKGDKDGHKKLLSRNIHWDRNPKRTRTRREIVSSVVDRLIFEIASSLFRMMLSFYNNR